MVLRSLAVAAVAAAACFQTSANSPMTLTYSVADLNDGTSHYDFVLTLDNHDHSWIPGNSYGWIVFGDNSGKKSAFEDWVGDPGSIFDAPWNTFTNTAGANNGPTLGDGRAWWTPVAVGQSISWSGVTIARVVPGGLRWSSLLTQGPPPDRAPGRPTAEFEVAIQLCQADFNRDTFVNGDDFDEFLMAFFDGAQSADFNRDGFVTGDDFDAFVARFENGC